MLAIGPRPLTHNNHLHYDIFCMSTFNLINKTHYSGLYMFLLVSSTQCWATGFFRAGNVGARAAPHGAPATGGSWAVPGARWGGSEWPLLESVWLCEIHTDARSMPHLLMEVLFHQSGSVSSQGQQFTYSSRTLHLWSVPTPHSLTQLLGLHCHFLLEESMAALSSVALGERREQLKMRPGAAGMA